MSYCAPTAPVNLGPVVFDYPTWVGFYPEFSYLTALQGGNYFNQACLYVDNTVFSPITDGSPTGARATILYAMTSHVARLFAPGPPVNGVSQPASPLVGRISNASEGSVSVATDMPSNPNAAWFNQTPYGAAAWQMMAPYRTFRYRPGNRPYLGTAYPWGRGGWR
jgi:Protein of unknown function (DUF4054)